MDWTMSRFFHSPFPSMLNKNIWWNLNTNKNWFGVRMSRSSFKRFDEFCPLWLASLASLSTPSWNSEHQHIQFNLDKFSAPSYLSPISHSFHAGKFLTSWKQQNQCTQSDRYWSSFSITTNALTAIRAIIYSHDNQSISGIRPKLIGIVDYKD